VQILRPTKHHLVFFFFCPVVVVGAVSVKKMNEEVGVLTHGVLPGW
jgi:hypothetical protein